MPSFEGKHYSSSFCITHVVFAVQFCITLVDLLVLSQCCINQLNLTERKAIIPSFEGKHYSSSFCITHVVFAVQFCITLVVLLVVKRISTGSRASEGAMS